MTDAANNTEQQAPRKRVVGRPFRKGQSGNPSGRPKALHELVELARAETLPTFQKLVELRDQADDPRVQLAAAREILDRAWGKPTQLLGGDPEQPIRHEHQVDLGALTDEQLAALESLGDSASLHSMGGPTRE
jgi:Family of unknown function (DUF5681)